MKKSIVTLLLVALLLVSVPPQTSYASTATTVTPEQRVLLLQQIQVLLKTITLLQAELDRRKALEAEQVEVTPPTDTIAPLTASDHVRGNPNAPVIVVTYTDLECPFCQRFHETMQQILDEYGVTGNIAWVVRHFPLTELHPEARSMAISSECVAEQGGNAAFWSFVDGVFADTSVDQILTNLNVNTTEYDRCVVRDDIQALVDGQREDAVNNGGRGTPWSVMLDSEGESLGEINGAQPYTVIEQLIQGIWREKGLE